MQAWRNGRHCLKVSTTTSIKLWQPYKQKLQWVAKSSKGAWLCLHGHVTQFLLLGEAWSSGINHRHRRIMTFVDRSASESMVLNNCSMTCFIDLAEHVRELHLSVFSWKNSRVVGNSIQYVNAKLDVDTLGELRQRQCLDPPNMLSYGSISLKDKQITKVMIRSTNRDPHP